MIADLWASEVIECQAAGLYLVVRIFVPSSARALVSMVKTPPSVTLWLTYWSNDQYLWMRPEEAA